MDNFVSQNKKEIIEYIVNPPYEDLCLDESFFNELKALFELFDLDRDGVLCLSEFEKILRALGRPCACQTGTLIVAN